MLSMPPDSTISAEPAWMMSCASMVAFMPEPQTLLTVVAPVASGNLAPRAACRVGAWPWPAGSKGHATHSQEPQWFTTAPIPAIRKLLDKVGWSVGDVDLFEINEAFAVVAMAAQRDLGIPREKLNINGGACALGHPIGATRARLIVTPLDALEAQNLKRGVAALCIGGG